jgi:hypothetical protein
MNYIPGWSKTFEAGHLPKTERESIPLFCFALCPFALCISAHHDNAI